MVGLARAKDLHKLWYVWKALLRRLAATFYRPEVTRDKDLVYLSNSTFWKANDAADIIKEWNALISTPLGSIFWYNICFGYCATRSHA